MPPAGSACTGAARVGADAQGSRMEDDGVAMMIDSDTDESELPRASESKKPTRRRLDYRKARDELERKRKSNEKCPVSFAQQFVWGSDETLLDLITDRSKVPHRAEVAGDVYVRLARVAFQFWTGIVHLSLLPCACALVPVPLSPCLALR